MEAKPSLRQTNTEAWPDFSSANKLMTKYCEANAVCRKCLACLNNGYNYNLHFKQYQMHENHCFIIISLNDINNATIIYI